MGPALNSGSISMKQLGVYYYYYSIAGWSSSSSRHPFVHLGEEKHGETKVSCLRTQHNDPGRGSNPDHSIRSRAH